MTPKCTQGFAGNSLSRLEYNPKERFSPKTLNIGLGMGKLEVTRSSGTTRVQSYGTWARFLGMIEALEQLGFDYGGRAIASARC